MRQPMKHKFALDNDAVCVLLVTWRHQADLVEDLATVLLHVKE